MKHSCALLLMILSATHLLSGCGKKPNDPDPVAAPKANSEVNVEDITRLRSRSIREAVEKNNAQEVKEILSQDRGLDINQIFENGETLLTIAIKNNHAEIIDLLLDRNVDILKPNMAGETPLIVAAKQGLSGLAQRLFTLYKDLDPTQLDRPDNLGNSALHHSVKGLHEELALFLINQGADTNLKDNQGVTPLQMAENLQLTQVATLIKSKTQAEIGTASRLDFINLVTLGDIASVNPILTKNPEILNDYAQEDLLIRLLSLQNQGAALAMTRLLLSYNVNPNGPFGANTTPLIESIKYERLNFTRLYISANADVNRRDNEEKSPLYWAIHRNNVGAVKLLLAYSVMVSYTYKYAGERYSFKACDFARSIRKKLDTAEEKQNSSQILRLLNCRTFPF